MGKYTAIKCNNCQKEYKIEDKIYVEINLTSKRSDLSYKSMDKTYYWCEECAKRNGLIYIPKKERTPEYSPPSAEEIITNFLESLGFTRE